MTQHDFTGLYNQYPEIIGHMKSEFNSHEFILELARCHQKLYVQALNAYVQGPAPFKIVHGVLAKHLHASPELASRVGTVNSKDIFTDENRCALWRKV